MNRVALTVDVVGSRSHDGDRLHTTLREAIERSERSHPAASRTDIHAGDEFQAGYDTLGVALAAAYDLRLDLSPEVDLRVGIGLGTADTRDAATGLEDGPAWWAAREAVDTVQARQGRAATRSCRTWVVGDHPCVSAVLAAVTALDQLWAGLDDRSFALLRHLRAGHSRATAAKDLGISPSAVSQRITRDGLDVVVEALTHLAEVDRA